jgi:hypothetical protein
MNLVFNQTEVPISKVTFISGYLDSKDRWELGLQITHQTSMFIYPELKEEFIRPLDKYEKFGKLISSRLKDFREVVIFSNDIHIFNGFRYDIATNDSLNVDDISVYHTSWLDNKVYKIPLNSNTKTINWENCPVDYFSELIHEVKEITQIRRKKEVES